MLKNVYVALKVLIYHICLFKIAKIFCLIAFPGNDSLQFLKKKWIKFEKLMSFYIMKF